MCGWVHLPRFIDKIRLHHAGKLHADYTRNFTKGFDRAWLDAAGLNSEQFIEVVRNTITDGEVADWVNANVKKSAEEKMSFTNFIMNCGSDTEDAHLRLEQRKTDLGLSHRTDVKTCVNMIDADEKRI